MSKIIGYLRVSKTDQDTKSQKLVIHEYAMKHNMQIDEFVSIKVSSRKDRKARRIDELMNLLEGGDTLIVAELSRLGRSIGEIARLVDAFIANKIKFIALKEGIKLNGNGDKDIHTTAMIGLFSMFAEIERKLISERTKEALQARKAAGVTLGRPKGPGRSKLDPHKEEIITLLKMGSPKTLIAKKYKTTAPNLHNWLRKHKIDVQPEL